MNGAGKLVRNKPILVISSHVVRGSIGNRAVAFALEALGHPSWILPTVTLPWHPGHGPGTRVVATDENFEALCKDLANAEWREEIAGIITGFIANKAQILAISNLIESLKQSNPKLKYLCDPVIGDFVTADMGYGGEGRLYVDEAVADAIRGTLMEQADIATPNLFELGWLNNGETAKDQSQVLLQGKNLSKQFDIGDVLITSVPGLMRSSVGNILINSAASLMCEHKALSNPPNGLGDLTSALYLSHYLGQKEPKNRIEKTTASVFEILARTGEHEADELALESNIVSLSRPMAMVTMRELK